MEKEAGWEGGGYGRREIGKEGEGRKGKQRTGFEKGDMTIE